MLFFIEIWDKIQCQNNYINFDRFCEVLMAPHTPPFKDYLDSKQVEENRVWPIFLFDLACAKSIILANSVGNPQRNGHFKCLFYEKNIKISIRYEVFGSFHSKYK